MARLIFAALALLAPLFAQQTVDNRSAIETAPFRTSPFSLGVCQIGDFWLNTNTVPATLEQCAAGNVWNAFSGGGSGGFVYTGLLASIPATCTVGQVAFITDATAGQNQYNCTATNTWTQNLNSGSGGANTALSNLATVSINTSLLPQTTVNLGSSSKPFQNLFLYGGGTFGSNSFELTGVPTTNRVWTLQDTTDTLVGRATTDTLTNKSIAGSEINSSTVGPVYGGTGEANNSANTITFSGNYGLTLTLSNTTSVTLPTNGTLINNTQNTSGNAGTATSVAGGAAGSIPYQTGSAATTFVSGNTSGSTDAVLTSTASSGSYSSTSLKNAPALSAANMSSFPTLNQNTTGNAATATAANTAITSGHVVDAGGSNAFADSGVVAANLVVSTSPGAGIAHFAGSTQALTSSAVSLTADVSGILPQTNGGLATGKIAFTPPTTAWTIAPAGDNQTTTVPNGTLLSNALTSGDVFFGVGGVATATSLAGAGIQAALNAPCQIAITSIGSTFTLSAGASCADTSGTAGTHNFGNIVPLVWFYDSTSTTLIQLTVTSATPSTGTVVYNTSAIAGNNGTMYVSSGGVGQQGPTGPTGAAGTNGIVSAVQADGTPLSTQSTVNFQDAITVNGIGVAWSNPSAGNVKPVITSAPTLGSITGFGTGVATALAANVSGTGAICLTSGSACNSASLTVGTSTVTSGTNTYIEYNNNGVLGEYQFVPIANGGLNSATAAASAVWGNPTGSTAAAQYTTTPIVGSIAVNSTTVPASGYGMNLNSSTSLGWFTAGSEALTLSTGLLIIKGSGTSTANNSLTIQNNNNHAASLGITGTTYSTSPYSADQVVLYETVAAGGMLIGTGNVAPVAFYVDATKVATLGTDYSLGLTLGSKLECTHGSNATCGMAQLSSGTVTVSTTAIGALATSTSGYSVTLTEQTCSGTCGAVQLGTVTGGSSFVINGLSTDNSYVYWEIHYIN